MSNNITEADEAFAIAVDIRLQAGQVEAVEAYKRLLSWQPEVRFPSNITPAYSSYRSGGQHAEQRKRLNEAPFMSESYLYELLGKEDARTLLALVHNIARALVGEKNYWKLDR